MGNEMSQMVDPNEPPKVLKERSVEALADYIQQKNVRKIVVMVGAGLSTSAGIPDFRSPDTGLYANLARLNLPHPQAVFDIDYFRENPRPFFALAKELLPGKFRPTLAHAFIKLLDEKQLLLKCFTQNIDTLEREAGLAPVKLVESHGSFAAHRCIDCKAPYPDDLMRHAIQNDIIPTCRECSRHTPSESVPDSPSASPPASGSTAYVKPDIVFFGESLPADFFDARSLPDEADLCIVMGTSLTVQPFALLPTLVREDVPRVLVNLTEAGDLGSRRDDVLLLEECDVGVAKLAEALGWEEDLDAVFERVNPEKARAERERRAAAVEESRAERAMGRDESLHRELGKLTLEVDEALHASSSHLEKVKEEVRQRDGSVMRENQSKGEGDISKETTEREKKEEEEKRSECEQPPSRDSPGTDAASPDTNLDRGPESEEPATREKSHQLHSD